MGSRDDGGTYANRDVRLGVQDPNRTKTVNVGAGVMSVYLIALHERSDSVWRKMEEAWPGRHHVITSTLAFVAPRGISTPSEIAKVLGITAGEDDRALGFVLQMDSYSGRSFTEAVDWLKKAQSNEQ